MNSTLTQVLGHRSNSSYHSFEVVSDTSTTEISSLIQEQYPNTLKLITNTSQSQPSQQKLIMISENFPSDTNFNKQKHANRFKPSRNECSDSKRNKETFSIDNLQWENLLKENPMADSQSLVPIHLISLHSLQGTDSMFKALGQESQCEILQDSSCTSSEDSSSDENDEENHSCEDEELVIQEPTSNKLFDALPYQTQDDSQSEQYLPDSSPSNKHRNQETVLRNVDSIGVAEFQNDENLLDESEEVDLLFSVQKQSQSQSLNIFSQDTATNSFVEMEKYRTPQLCNADQIQNSAVQSPQRLTFGSAANRSHEKTQNDSCDSAVLEQTFGNDEDTSEDQRLVYSIELKTKPILQLEEVRKFLNFYEQIKLTWLKLNSIKQASNIDEELTPTLTHQLTQITVYYQLCKDLDGFCIEKRKILQLASLAREILASGKSSGVPRQTRNQFVMVMVEMLTQQNGARISNKSSLLITDLQQLISVQHRQVTQKVNHATQIVPKKVQINSFDGNGPEETKQKSNLQKLRKSKSFEKRTVKHKSTKVIQTSSLLNRVLSKPNLKDLISLNLSTLIPTALPQQHHSMSIGSLDLRQQMKQMQRGGSLLHVGTSNPNEQQQLTSGPGLNSARESLALTFSGSSGCRKSTGQNKGSAKVLKRKASTSSIQIKKTLQTVNSKSTLTQPAIVKRTQPNQKSKPRGTTIANATVKQQLLHLMQESDGADDSWI